MGLPETQRNLSACPGLITHEARHEGTWEVRGEPLPDKPPWLAPCRQVSCQICCSGGLFPPPPCSVLLLSRSDCGQSFPIGLWAPWASLRPFTWSHRGHPKA